VGGFDEGIGLKQLVQQFSAACTRSPVFSDEGLAHIYSRAKAALAAGQQVANNDRTALVTFRRIGATCFRHIGAGSNQSRRHHRRIQA
jgi:hypothetical protein